MKMQDENIRIVGFKPLGSKKSIILLILAAIFGIAILFISFFFILIVIYLVILLSACGYFDKYNLGLNKNSQAYRNLQKKRKITLSIMIALPLLIFFLT